MVVARRKVEPMVVIVFVEELVVQELVVVEELAAAADSLSFDVGREREKGCVESLDDSSSSTSSS